MARMKRMAMLGGLAGFVVGFLIATVIWAVL
jgi:hypothetical protein